MPDKNKPGNAESIERRKAADSGADRMISNKLRQLYDGIIEEGTPDRLLDLLEKLDQAEKAANSK